MTVMPWGRLWPLWTVMTALPREFASSGRSYRVPVHRTKHAEFTQMKACLCKLVFWTIAYLGFSMQWSCFSIHALVLVYQCCNTASIVIDNNLVCFLTQRLCFVFGRQVCLIDHYKIKKVTLYSCSKIICTDCQKLVFTKHVFIKQTLRARWPRRLLYTSALLVSDYWLYVIPLKVAANANALFQPQQRKPLKRWS